MDTARSTSEPGLAAIVLAAGLSSRMGAQNKLLLPVGGAPLVRRTVSVVASYPFVETVVVTGHESERVERAVSGLPVRAVFNPRYGEGQTTSVRAGLAALSRPRRGVMVCLADQPLLDADDVRAIAEAFLARPECRVLVPTFDGARGNPIVLAERSLADILGRGVNFGCRQFIAKNADLVTTLAMPSDHVLADLDRPEDYGALLDALGPRA
jgi:molybdenum cofactor cytidylyltransferase